MVKSEIEWPSTCKRFVVYMDIMGFQDMVFRNTHSEVLEKMEIFRIPINKIKNEAIDQLKGRKSGWKVFENTVVRPVIFSDSVLLFSSDDSLGSAENIIWSVQSIIDHALEKGIPIKGAIAFGEQTADFKKSLYFGRPLIDAWELQKETNFYGIVLHHTIEKHLVEKEWMRKLDGTDILKYPTPLKSGVVTHYVVNWLESQKVAGKVKESLPRLYSGVSGSARLYVDNTMKFVEWEEQGYASAKGKRGIKK